MKIAVLAGCENVNYLTPAQKSAVSRRVYKEILIAGTVLLW